MEDKTSKTSSSGDRASVASTCVPEPEKLGGAPTRISRRTVISRLWVMYTISSLIIFIIAAVVGSKIHGWSMAKQIFYIVTIPLFGIATGAICFTLHWTTALQPVLALIVSNVSLVIWMGQLALWIPCEGMGDSDADEVRASKPDDFCPNASPSPLLILKNGVLTSINFCCLIALIVLSGIALRQEKRKAQLARYDIELAETQV